MEFTSTEQKTDCVLRDAAVQTGERTWEYKGSVEGCVEIHQGRPKPSAGGAFRK